MKYTGNYNLKKPEGSDVVNIEDLNDNADIIDQALKAHDDALATKETPQGAQEKADAALNSAKQYTDQEVAEVSQALAAHKAESVTHKVSNRRPIATDDETQNFKQGDIWIYENYINEEEYEFEVYQCIDNKSGKAKWGKYIEHVAAPQRIYGIEIDETNSNPETSVVYTDDAVGFTPARGNNGNFDWGSWENVIKEEFQIKPCVLQNKQVNYYLNHEDYTKKIDGTTSKLDGTDGDVMVEFGIPIYYKWTTLGDIQKIQVSTKYFDGAVKYAHEVEDGYNQMPYYPLLLTQILFVLIFKSTDSQTALGRGRVDGAGYINTGNTDTKGFMYGSTKDEQMKFLGIEDYWGNKYYWVDGLVTNSSYNLLIGNSNFNDSGSGYTQFPSGKSSSVSGYIDKVQGGNNKGFIIKSNGGSETTHYCDYGGLNSGRVAYFGGRCSFGSTAGFARLLLSDSASAAYAGFAARLFCKSNDKIYIGAYLGTEQNGKLRSTSGTTPTDSKTIGSFRTLAKANN